MKRILSLLVLIGFLVGCAPMTALLKLHGQDPFDPTKHYTVIWTKPDWGECEQIRFLGDGIFTTAPHYTWTYKRQGQEFLWQFYGNDNPEGMRPCFHGEPWSEKEWWRRNSWHDWSWYWMGIAHWSQEEVPYSSYNNRHLERIDPWFDKGPLRISWVRDRTGRRNAQTDEWGRTKRHWYPYLYLRLPFNVKFWIGWKPTRGQFAISLKVREEE